MKRLLTASLLIILLVGCGTCHQQVAQTRLGVEQSLNLLEAYAPGAGMTPDQIADWSRAAKALLEAALSEWERACPPDPPTKPPAEPGPGARCPK